MRNLLAFTAAMAITVSGLGWYLGWFKVQSVPSGSGHQQVTIDIDSTKLTQDAGRVGKKVLKRTEAELEKAMEKKVDEATPAAATSSSVTATNPQ